MTRMFKADPTKKFFVSGAESLLISNKACRDRPSGHHHQAATYGGLWLPSPDAPYVIPGDAALHVPPIDAVWVDDGTTSGVTLSGLAAQGGFYGQKNTGDCGCWYFAMVIVGDGRFATYVGNGSPEGTASPYGSLSGKSRACAGDLIKVKFVFEEGVVDGESSLVGVTSSFPLENHDWSVLLTWSQSLPPGTLTPHVWRVLYACGYAEPGTPEASLLNWFLPPMRTWQLPGYPRTIWNDTNTYPITWAGAIPLAQAFTDAEAAFGGWPTVTYAFSTDLFTDPLNGTSMDPGELPGWGLASGNGATFIYVTSPDLPASIVAGAPFNFKVKVHDAYTNGDGRFIGTPVNNTARGADEFLESVSGGVTPIPNNQYDPGTLAEIGTTGVYDITGFKIFVSGPRRLWFADRGKDVGNSHRLSQLIDVAPAAPKNAFPLALINNTVVTACGDYLRGGPISFGSSAISDSDFRPETLAGLDPNKGWHGQGGAPAFQVNHGLPLVYEIYDRYGNVCSNDDTSEWTLTIEPHFSFPDDYLAAPYTKHLTGTVTRRASKGRLVFDDVRVFGWGKYNLKISGPGGTTPSTLTLIVVGVPTVVWNTFDEEKGLDRDAPTGMLFHYCSVQGDILINSQGVTIHVSDGMRPGGAIGTGDYVIAAAHGELSVSISWPSPGFFDVKFQDKNQGDFKDAGAYSPSFKVL